MKTTERGGKMEELNQVVTPKNKTSQIIGQRSQKLVERWELELKPRQINAQFKYSHPSN